MSLSCSRLSKHTVIPKKEDISVQEDDSPNARAKALIDQVIDSSLVPESVKEVVTEALLAAVAGDELTVAAVIDVLEKVGEAVEQVTPESGEGAAVVEKKLVEVAQEATVKAVKDQQALTVIKKATASMKQYTTLLQRKIGSGHSQAGDSRQSLMPMIGGLKELLTSSLAEIKKLAASQDDTKQVKEVKEVIAAAGGVVDAVDKVIEANSNDSDIDAAKNFLTELKKELEELKNLKLKS